MEHYLALLKRCDEPSLDVPEDTSILDGLTEMMEVLQKRIESELGINCALSYGTGPCAAWYKDLWRLEDALDEKCPAGMHEFRSGAALNIRVSNFGRLATIFGCTTEALNTYPVESLASLVEEQGFNYAPVAVLANRYSGENVSSRLVNQTNYRWFERFFFYSS